MAKCKQNNKEVSAEKQAEIDANWYRNLRIIKPVGLPTVSKKRISAAVNKAMVVPS